MPLILLPGQTVTGTGNVGASGGSPHILISLVDGGETISGGGLPVPTPSSFSTSSNGWDYSITNFTAAEDAPFDWLLTVSPNAQPGDYFTDFSGQADLLEPSYAYDFFFTVIAGSSGSGSGSGGSSSGSGGGAGGPGVGPPCCGDGIALPLSNQPQINASQMGASCNVNSSNLGNNPQVLGNNFQGQLIGQYATYGACLPNNIGNLPPFCTCGPSSACNTCGTGGPGIVIGM